MNHKSPLLTQLEEALSELKTQLIVERLLLSISIVFLLVTILHVFKLLTFSPVAPEFLIALFAGVSYVAIKLYALIKSDKYRSLKSESFTQYLNTLDKSLEDSAQLALTPETELNGLKQLQFEKISPVLRQLLSDKKRWKPKLSYKKSVFLLLIAGTINYSGIGISIETSSDNGQQFVVDKNNEGSNLKSEIESQQVTVSPPSYTEIPFSEQTTLEVEAYSLSQIAWRFKFSKVAGEYFLVFSNGEEIPLVSDDSGEHIAKTVAQSTRLYRVVHRERKDDRLIEIDLTAVHPLIVLKDKPPEIKIIEPKTTITRISKGGNVELSVKALVKDDFEITRAEILASVAKGSGESVKFRDETFSFDRYVGNEHGREYIKEWNLSHLGMEPGDEVYFRVFAYDNKAPEANLGKSSTVIVRWLDDEEQQVSAEGLVIDFIPEYFKSQRQIIIETEQLILDKPELSKQEFAETSYGLGHAQSDLKQKYGQYLGDEFEEGSGQHHDAEEHSNSESHSEHDHEHEGESEGKTADNHEHFEQGRPEVYEEGHAHDLTRFDNDKVGAAALIARFGHAHESAIVDPVTTRNPKGLMKKAVAIMWQAELHLMLGEPEKALPYEYEALKYIKQAKLADRIYVKRLGFEPPPVSEERRLKGELDDIQNLVKRKNPAIDQTINSVKTGQLLTLLLTPMPTQHILNEAQLRLLRDVGELITEKADDSPTLIKSAATIENIIIEKSMNIPQCDSCVNELIRALWQLQRQTVAAPEHRRSYLQPNDSLLQRISEISQTINVMTELQ